MPGKDKMSLFWKYKKKPCIISNNKTEKPSKHLVQRAKIINMLGFVDHKACQNSAIIEQKEQRLYSSKISHTNLGSGLYLAHW